MMIDRSEKLKLYTKEVKNYLRKVGHKLGFDTIEEYDTGSGKIDLVWCKKLEYPLKNGQNLPIVGFEIEASWRTQKHLKGDVFNLLSLSPSLGVILLIEKGFDRTKGKSGFNLKNNINSIKRYINGYGGVSRLEVWTARDVEELYNRVFDSNYDFFKM